MLDSEFAPPFLDSTPPHWAARGLSWVIIGLFAISLTTGLVLQVPETVSGRFNLTPLAGADPIRARKDGIVTDIRVREGDTVAAGAVLLLLRAPSLNDRSSDRRALESQARADAERLGLSQNQYESGKLGDEAEARRLRARTESLRGLIASKQKRLAVTRELADSAQSGYRSGAVNRVEAARLDLEVTTLTEEVQTATSELEDAQIALSRLAREAQSRELEYRQKRRTLQESIETAQIRIDALGRDLADLTDSGLAVTSPCRGAVLRLHVNGPGAVVREAEAVSEIACAGAHLLAEVVVPEAGVPLIRPGQVVKLRYDAFPYQRHGVRFGTVRWVGPAGVATGDSVSFRVLVNLADDSIRVSGRSRALLAGMSGRADVVIGRRSLVSYAIEPVRALRENLRDSPQ